MIDSANSGPGMIPAELEAIRKRAEAATPGPWQQSYYAPLTEAAKRRTHPDDRDRLQLQEERIIRGPGRVGTPECNQLFRLEGIEATAVNAAFIAHARSDIPALLDEIDSLTKHIADVENREIALQEALEGHRLMSDIQDRRIAHLIREWARLRDYWGNVPIGESQKLPWQVFDKCARELEALLDGRKPE